MPSQTIGCCRGELNSDYIPKWLVRKRFYRDLEAWYVEKRPQKRSADRIRVGKCMTGVAMPLFNDNVAAAHAVANIQNGCPLQDREYPALRRVLH